MDLAYKQSLTIIHLKAHFSLEHSLASETHLERMSTCTTLYMQVNKLDRKLDQCLVLLTLLVKSTETKHKDEEDKEDSAT